MADTSDTLANWRRVCEQKLWSSAPKTFQAFWTKVESSELLHLLCDTPQYERKWKHPLIYQLTQLWMCGPKRGRLHLVEPLTGSEPPITLSPIADLDRIVQSLIGEATIVRYPKHSAVSLQLLRDFFPEDIPPSWTPAELESRIEACLAERRASGSLEKEFIDLLSRATACSRWPDNDDEEDNNAPWPKGGGCVNGGESLG